MIDGSFAGLEGAKKLLKNEKLVIVELPILGRKTGVKSGIDIS